MADSPPKPYGNVKYADPKNGKYPIDTKEHARAAWSYINQAKNAGEYSSSELAAIKGRIRAACKHFGIDIADDTASKNSDTFPVEIFATGEWGGRSWSTHDLDAMVRNFQVLQPKGIRPPVKLGHDDAQVLAGQQDGDPALGWVAGLRRLGSKLVADIANVPTVLKDLIRAGRYQRVSSEIYPRFEQTTAEKNLVSGATGPALSAIAFLGADVPEVKTLEDLGAFLHVEQVRLASVEDGVLIATAPRRFAADNSLFDLQRDVSDAVCTAYGSNAYLVDLFPDYAIVALGDEYFRIPFTTDANGEPTLGAAMGVEVQYAPATDSGSHPRTMPPVSAAMTATTEEPMTEAEKQELTQLQDKLTKLTEQVTATETARVAGQAELERVKAENARLAERAAISEAVARHQAAERFAEARLTAANLRISQAQKPLLIALYEKLSASDLVIKASEAAECKLLREGETARDLTAAELLERFIDAGPGLTAMLREVATTGADAVAKADSVEDAVKAVALREKLDLSKPEDVRRATQIAMREKPELKRNYGSAA